MLVQPINQNVYTTQSNVNFEAIKKAGTLKKFNSNEFVIKLHINRPGDEKALKEITKIYNLGKLGLISMSKFRKR